jgi:hypothetical protein
MCWETAFKDAPLKSHAEEKAGGNKSTGQECEREPAGGGQAAEKSGAPPGGLWEILVCGLSLSYGLCSAPIPALF